MQRRMRGPGRRRAAGWALLLLLAAAGMPVRAEEGLSEVLGAFNEVSTKGAEASAQAQALAFKHNETLQHLRIQGKIPENVFQANQANFSRINNGFVEQAAKNNGLNYRPQQAAPGKLPTPGVDTDAIVSSGQPGKPMTAQQVSGARADYNRNVNEFLSKNGVSGGRAPNTNTSIMPDPGSMTESEWRKAIDEADRAGEVVYKNPQAAAAEAKIRAGQPLTPAEANARVQEVNRLANQHFAHADQLDDAARKLPPGPQRAALEAQAQIARHNGAKYVNRITETGNAMAQQHGLPPAGQTGNTMGQAAVRGVDQAQQAAAAGAMSQHFTEQATRGYVENMANIAKASRDPAVVAQSEKAIAQAMQGLSPSAQGRILEGLRASNGDQFARNVAQTARTLPRPPPGAPGGPPAPGRIGTALKYLGPAAILYGGAKDLYGVATAADPSHEAGKKLGGFVVGTAGGAIGAAAVGKAGAVLGGTIGSIFGPPGTAIGAGVGGFIGAVVGGVGGYIYGSGHGTEMGDTNSKYWDKNKSDEEFNKLAAANSLKTPEQVYQSLLSMGVSPDRALALAKLYQQGSLGAFRDGLRALREEMIKNNKWSPRGFRRFADLGTNEVSDLLHCLCSASLGANPWVAQGYNTTIPPGADPKAHSCGSLANGPCMAQGFGCWRSFMNLASENARACFEAKDVPFTRDNRAAVNSAYQQQYEKPFEVEFTATPMEVCPGDKVTVSVSARGGMGDYQYQWEVGSWPLQRPEGMPNFHTPTTASSFTLTCDPTLKRGLVDGHWVYTRPAEAYNTYVRVYASCVTFEGGEERRKYINRILTITLRPHHICEKLHPPPPPEPPLTKTKAPSTPPPTAPVTPPPPVVKGPTPRGPSDPAAPPSAPPPPAPPAAGGKGGKSGPASGPAPSGPASAPADQPEGGSPAAPPGAPAAGPAGPKGGHDPGWNRGKGWKKPTAAEVAGGTSAVPPAVECQIGGGGYAMEGQPAVIFAEVPPTHRVRLTIQGSDGYAQTAEGMGKAELSRAPNPNGRDVIIIEDLDVPGCREAMQRTYGTNGMPIAQEPITGDVSTVLGGLRGVEPPVAEGTILATPASAADEYIRTVGQGAADQAQTGLGLMDAQTQLGAASRAGDKTLADITRIQDSAGAAAAATRDQSAAQVAAADTRNNWGNTIGDAVSEGIQQGLSSAASAFGAAAADKVSGAIFDDGDDDHHDTAGGGTDEGAPPSGGGSAGTVASTPKDAKSTKKTSSGGHHHEGGADDHAAGSPAPTPSAPPPPPGSPAPATVSVTCPSCGVTSTFPEGQVSPWCPNCCAGPQSTQCATCGYLWCGKKGTPPDCCPNCGTCGSGPAPEALIPPGGGEILVTPADPGAGSGGPSL